jgi:hypothetical protein
VAGLNQNLWRNSLEYASIWGITGLRLMDTLPAKQIPAMNIQGGDGVHIAFR